MKTFDDLPQMAKLIWAAGVFEARVTIQTKQIQIKIESKYRAFLERFKECVGVGVIYNKAPHPGKPHETYMYKCNTPYETATLLKIVLPFLTHAKQQIVIARIKIIESTTPYQREAEKHRIKE